MVLDGVSFHNVAETVPDGGGHLLQRVPSNVLTDVNDEAKDTYRNSSGVEVRFVANETPVEVELSSPGGNQAIPYWGPLRAGPPVELGQEPTVMCVERPSELDRLRDGAIESAFSTRCARIRFGWTPEPVRYHGVSPETAVTPPDPDLTPDRQLLAYGTSITEGHAATGQHLAYVAQTARRLGCDLLNLGTGGSAHCELEIAEHIASLEWDIAVLALSVNMCGQFPVATFRERAEAFVNRIAATGRPVAAITLYPHYRDLVIGADREEARDYREALREIVDDAPECVTLIEGDALLEPSGLMTDLLHPSDDGMIGIGERLAETLRPMLADE